MCIAQKKEFQRISYGSLTLSLFLVVSIKPWYGPNNQDQSSCVSELQFCENKKDQPQDFAIARTGGDINHCLVK